MSTFQLNISIFKKNFDLDNGTKVGTLNLIVFSILCLNLVLLKELMYYKWKCFTLLFVSNI